MTLPHTPLDLAKLSTAAQRALGPGPGRAMAARGMMPLPPADQVAVLYQLSLDTDAAVAATAKVTATGLPDKLLAGTLADASLDPRVLDYFGLLVVEKPAVFDAIVLNPSTADVTIATLAGRAGAREVDLISQNEQRLLRHPEIVGAMYMNRRARMSTIDRVVELAVRNQVRIPGLAAWDEISRALTGGDPITSDDALFEAVVGPRDDSELVSGDASQALPEEDEAPSQVARTSEMLELHVIRPSQVTVRVPLRRTRIAIGSSDRSDVRIEGVPAQWLVVQLDHDNVSIVVAATGQRLPIRLKQEIAVEGARLYLSEIPFRDLPVPHKVRAATMGDAFVRSEAIRDPLRLVALAAIKSPGVTEFEAARYAGNQGLGDDVIRYISQNREWTKNYAVKVSLCRNPKTPMSEAAKFLPFLREKDLTNLSKSKGVPSALAAQARKLLMQRRGK